MFRFLIIVFFLFVSLLLVLGFCVFHILFNGLFYLRGKRYSQSKFQVIKLFSQKGKGSDKGEYIEYEEIK
ncbi:MAG: hypothetical protein Pg6B_02200 [Candidatus Azobacteroides pseudotrichonymphae]|nr:MAG: hypothetical protein Pg6B_02200 [Candidatus Azobacteroides pseudotrichonymphae]